MGLITILPERKKVYYPKITTEERDLISEARTKGKTVLVPKPLYDIIEEYSKKGGPIPRKKLKEIGFITERGVARTSFLNLVGLFPENIRTGYMDFALVYTWIETPKGEKEYYYQIRRNISMIRNEVKGMRGIRFIGRAKFKLIGRPPKKIRDYIERGAITRESRTRKRKIEAHLESKARIDKYDEDFKRKMYSVLVELTEGSDYDFILHKRNDAEKTDEIPKGAPTSWRREKIVSRPSKPIEARWEIYDQEYDVLRRSTEARLPYGWEDWSISKIVKEFR